LARRYPLKREVESCNNRRLVALEGPDHTYNSVDSAGYDVHQEPIPDESAKQLLDRLIAVSKITLKVRILALHTRVQHQSTLKIGAQVMLIQVSSCVLLLDAIHT
jgi:hypothetical protein